MRNLWGDALFVSVILFAMGFTLMFEFLARPPVPQVPVTKPIAVFIKLPPKRIRHKPRVVVIPVVVGAANCTEPDDSMPCRPIYDFRQRCSASWPKEKPHS